MKLQRYKRLAWSSILGCFTMLALSYLWHGVVLNDISSLKYDFKLFIALLTTLYLFVSFFLSFVISLYRPKSNLFFKHLTLGVFFGFMMYLIAFVLGVSFSDGGLSHVVVDFLWQMFEQAIGASVISFYFTFVIKLDKIKKMDALG